MPDIASTVQQALDAATQMQNRCIGCNTCTHRCNLLEDEQWNMGSVCRETRAALEDVTDLEELKRAIEAHGHLYRFVRSCEACGRCTTYCPQGLSMGDLWRPWRALARAGGYIADSDVNPVNVDRTWHTFSVFRALNGVDYSDLPSLQLDEAGGETGRSETGDRSLSHDHDSETEDRTGSHGHETTTCPLSHYAPLHRPLPHSLSHAETLFFPGCTLASYAPDLVRAAFSWIEEHVGPCLMTEHCCAWPLECAGELERTVAWRKKIVTAAHRQGVKRIVTVCPGCEKQLAAAAKTTASDMEFVSLALLLAEAGLRVDDHMLDGVARPVTVIDSCNDRAGAHGPFVRQLFENVDTRPFPCTGQDAWCCGAGGNVAAFDMQLSRERTRRSFSLCAQAGASTLVASCPTCAYTYAFERWLSAREGRGATGTPEAPGEVPSINYLEVVFGVRIDWPAVFEALVDMWQGEHAAWVAEQLG